ncbi:MAG: response regulator transcription factor [Parvibaculum sp.]|uniref:response regulator transcription factor n=1 Tax=Parvibaculum sp. TaxID=2024848 RepID=UPI0027313633|nr:response regulator transcription factor [Parvibaculum sp.]MDP2150290.1 response regulator transcription factor [Parvibaculum sp.]
MPDQIDFGMGEVAKAVTMARKILIVDDDADFLQSLSNTFDLHDEFRCETVKTAAAAFERVKAERFDLVLLDVGLPDMDGREVCRLMRRERVSAPIIMLTGAASDADMILGLEAGADDYVVKPVRFGVLLARIRAHLRSYEQNDDATFQVGPYVFHTGTKSLVCDRGKKIRLTEREAAIVRFLHRMRSRAVRRDVLLTEVWGYNSTVTTHTIETHIYRLRQKIERDPSRAEILVTEAGGYRLVS